MLLINNADDLGTSHLVNEAIFELMNEGLVTSATLIANAPAAEEAVARSRDFPRCSFGVHLNLSAFAPLRHSGDLAAIVDRSGCLDGRIHTVVFDARLIAAIEGELVAQVERALDLGLRISHFDSHQHVHVIPRLFLTFKRVQRRFKIRRMRSSINLVPPNESMSAVRALKKAAFHLALTGLYRTRSPQGLGHLRSFIACVDAGRMRRFESLELMLHPGAESPVYVDEVAALRGRWRQLLPAGARLGTYYDL